MLVHYMILRIEVDPSQNVVPLGSGVMVPVVATKPRTAAKEFLAVLPERPVAKAEGAVTRGESMEILDIKGRGD